MNERENTLLRILRQQMVPALGCTEPAAVALSVATARKYVTGKIRKISVTVDKNTYKNGARVTIPGTNEKGLNFAAALGAIIGSSDKGLEVFEEISEEAVDLARNYIAQKKVEVNLDRKKDILYIYSKIITNEGYAVCIIEREHTNVVYIEANGNIIKEKGQSLTKVYSDIPKSYQMIQKYTLDDFKELADNIAAEKIDFIDNAINMNFKLAIKGLKNKNNFGYKLRKVLANSGVNPEKSTIFWPIILTMSAVYERMNGNKETVMAVAGSGNQGLTVTVPLTAMAKLKNCKKEILWRSVLFTSLITVYMKSYTGILSPVCGVGSIASPAVSGGIVYMEGGSLAQIGTAIKNTIASTAGMICDGAKTSCALKAGTGVSAALALSGTMLSIPTGDGIISQSVEGTIQNIGYLVNKGMTTTDDSIIDILVKNDV